MTPIEKTLEYYKENAANFADTTGTLDFHETEDRFLSYLSDGAAVLDLGCGAGRDAKYFLSKGYRVTAVDGSPELCRIASQNTGIEVRCELFEDPSDIEAYDGIWACASILHLPKEELRNVFAKIAWALKPGGILYTSFKYGTFEGERNGRYFTDFTEETFAEFMAGNNTLINIETWTSADVRPGRGDEKWLNLILRKEA